VREGEWKLLGRGGEARSLGNLNDSEPEKQDYLKEKPELVTRLLALHNIMGERRETEARGRNQMIRRARRLALSGLMALLTLPAAAKELPAESPDTNQPVKVFILMGQSNMVGMGDISGGSSRWGKQLLDPVVSVYPSEYSPKADYDSLIPIKTMKLPAFGGVRPTPYPGGGTHVVRGHIEMDSTGVYRFKPGYQASTHNVMEIDGKEVHRKEVDKDPMYTDIRLTAGKKVPFKITYLTDAANGLGWVQRTDIPGTLETVVKKDGKFPHLVDDEGNWTVRSDVTYKGVISATGQGPLTVGIQGNTIGPELGFGHVMGYYYDEPVLLIKASIGNRSLGWDILPPGSERFTHDGRVYAGYKDSPASWHEDTKPEPINWYAGKQYDDFVKATHEVLDDFDRLFPPYKNQGYHYNRNAETYMLVGAAFGRGMIKLLAQSRE
jgi:hypothetical protein